MTDYRNKDKSREDKEKEADEVGQRRDNARRRWEKYRSSGHHICDFCGHTGWVVALHRQEQNTYAFRCKCCMVARDLELSKSIPEWDDSLTEFERMRS
jgi:hypothetical protein